MRDGALFCVDGRCRHGHAGMYGHMASAGNDAGSTAMTKVAEALAANKTLTSVDLGGECGTMA